MFSINSENICVSLVERPPTDGIKQMMIDLDLHYEIETHFNKEHIIKFIEILSDSIHKFTNQLKINENIRYYVQLRENGYFSNNKYKNGVHIVMPNFICHTDIQHMIREYVLANNDLQKIFQTTNNSSDIFDKSVISSNGFFLYGRGKENVGSYKNKFIFEFNPLYSVKDTEYNIKLDKVNVPTITLLSQRKEYVLEKVAQLKDEYKLKPVEIQAPTPIENKTPIIKLKSKNIEIKTLNDAECAEYTYILSNINTDRFSNYQDWFKIAVILKQAGVRFIFTIF